jgi:mitotic spindle assembly checkpoint protein MAD1
MKWLSLLINKMFCFLFQLNNSGPDLLETPYTATLGAFIDLHLKQQHSTPVFLSAITVDLFSHQTN